ncbi:transposase [Paenibacillus marinisediminis]
MAIWLITQHDVSINAVQLSSIIQVTYKTAWSILHKIRSIISAVDLDSPLEGNVQGIVEYHCKPTFRSTLELLSYEHPLIVAASITADEHIIALKMKLVNRQHLRDRTLRPIASSTFNDLHTCADPSNIEIIPHPYRALRFRHLKDAFQQARRWMITTFHGIGQKYLQRYLDEFCFRYNARNHPLSAYERLVSMCMYTNYATHVRSNAPSYMYRAA